MSHRTKHSVQVIIYALGLIECTCGWTMEVGSTPREIAEAYRDHIAKVRIAHAREEREFRGGLAEDGVD